MTDEDKFAEFRKRRNAKRANPDQAHYSRSNFTSAADALYDATLALMDSIQPHFAMHEMSAERGLVAKCLADYHKIRSRDLDERQ